MSEKLAAEIKKEKSKFSKWKLCCLVYANIPSIRYRFAFFTRYNVWGSLYHLQSHRDCQQKYATKVKAYLHTTSGWKYFHGPSCKLNLNSLKIISFLAPELDPLLLSMKIKLIFPFFLINSPINPLKKNKPMNTSYIITWLLTR